MFACLGVKFFDLFMSQGAEKSQLSKVGIEPGPQDLKVNTLPRRCKSRLQLQGSRSELYTYPYYIFPCFTIDSSPFVSQIRGIILLNIYVRKPYVT